MMVCFVKQTMCVAIIGVSLTKIIFVIEYRLHCISLDAKGPDVYALRINCAV